MLGKLLPGNLGVLLDVDKKRGTEDLPLHIVPGVDCPGTLGGSLVYHHQGRKRIISRILESGCCDPVLPRPKHVSFTIPDLRRRAVY